MGYKVIAPVGDNLKALFVGIKEFPTEKVFLLTPHENMKKAKKLARKLDEFTIKSKIIELKENSLEEMFRIFGELCAHHNQDELIVNIATGDKMTMCSALSASFANGLKAFDVDNGRTMLLPIMKLSYYNELNERKLKILKTLDSENYTSLKELSAKLDMSISLLSYHINGNLKYKGLREFRLVVVKESHNQLFVKLSEMGNLLLKGYIQPKS